MLQPPLRSRSRAATLCSCLAVLALAACSKGGGGGGPAAPEVVPELDPTPRFVSTATIRLTGKSLRAGSQIDVQGGTAPVTTTLEEKARNFDLEVPLHANRLNRLLLLERFAAGGSSPGLIVEVIQDGEAPTLTIDYPTSGATLGSETVTVVGKVGDCLSGEFGLEVSVDGRPAQVDVGTGSNGSYLSTAISLQAGTRRSIQVVAKDAAGNATERSIEVERAPDTGFRLRGLGGDLQSGPIHSRLPQPLEVKAIRPDGSAFAGKVIRFEVTRSDGGLALAPEGDTARAHSIATDNEGVARVWWTLGSDAGLANNRVEVTSLDAGLPLVFVASAKAGPVQQINVAGGHYQIAPAGGRALNDLEVWVSDGCNPVADVPVTFRITEGDGFLAPPVGAFRPELVVRTNATGRARARFQLPPFAGDHEVTASLPDDAMATARFRIRGVTPTAQGTSFHGEVFDNSSLPIGGARCVLRDGGGNEATTTTDRHGRFQFDDLALQGRADLFVHGATADLLDGQPLNPNEIAFPDLHFEPVVLPDVANELGQLILLPRLSPTNARSYDGSEDVTLTVAGVEGLSITIRAGSMTLPDGRRPTPDAPLPVPVPVSLNQVHHDDIPMPMPNGAAPPFSWTLQPGGALFDPPAEVTYPNMSGLAPGSASYFLTFDHDTGRFEIVGTGQVSEDGTVVQSDPGSGLTLAGWGCNCPPYSVNGDCDGCDAGSGNDPGGASVAEDEECDPCKQWIDALQADYDAAAGLPSAALKHQLLCLAQRSCGPDAVECPGVPNWADGFVKNVIEDWANNIGNNVFNDFYDNLPQWVIDRLNGIGIPFTDIDFNAADFAALDAGVLYHFPLELLPAFYRNCGELLKPEADAKHECLFEQAVAPCFDQVTELSPSAREIAKWLVPKMAGALREGIQLDCKVLGYFIDFGNSPSLRDDDLFDYPEIGNDHLEADFQVEEWTRIGTLRVQRTQGPFFAAPGDTVQLAVLDANGNDVTSSCRFHPLVGGDMLRVDANGSVTITDSPTGTRLVPAPVQILCERQGEAGMFQFALLDRDSDGDLIVDSWELAAGRDPMNREPRNLDTDGDGVTDLHEALILTDMTRPDTDGDGDSDGFEVAIFTDPRRAGGIPPRLNENAIVSVGGVVVQPDVFGRFEMPNLAAQDLFGAAGPGSAPDFLSDDALRVTVVIPSGDRNYYAFSEAFRIRQGETYQLQALTFTETPPPLPASLRVTVGMPTIRIDESTGVTTIARLGDGSDQDVSAATDWTTYRTSNPTIATIDENGTVRGVAEGSAFLTAVNGGATAVTRVRVAPDDAPSTTVIGFVTLPDGTPVNGATVSLIGQGSTTSSGANGRFELPNVVVTGTVTVLASATIGDDLLRGTSGRLQPVPDGLTDAGLIVLEEATSAGTDFLLAFPGNFDANGNLTLFITGDLATSGEVQIPGLGFAETFEVVPGEVTAVPIPIAAQVDANDGIAARGIQVSTIQPVCVYALNRRAESTDAYAAIPIPAFGNDHIVASYGGLTGSQMAVAAVVPDTVVTITPRQTIGARPAGVPFEVTLQPGEVYQLRASGQDVSGTRVQSDQPIGVFGSHRCAFVPVGIRACDHLIEMLPATPIWRERVFSVSLAGRARGDTFRVFAREDATSVTIDGPAPQSFTLDAGAFREVVLDGTNSITGDRPILVMQYANGSNFDNRVGDPFMMLLPWENQFQNAYTVATPTSGFSTHFVNVVVPTATAQAGGLDLDGSPVPASMFEAIPGSTWSGARLPITAGTHQLSAPTAFGLYVYGWGNFDSYGYPGGMSLGSR